jgi:hypothetical protein
MVISVEDAIAIFEKWKDDSAHILVFAESPYRHVPRDIERKGLTWEMSQHFKVSRVTTSLGGGGSKKAIVEFEGRTGNLSFSIGRRCRFEYQDPREADCDIRKEAEDIAVSGLFVFFPYKEGFHCYELRAPMAALSHE